MTTNAGVAKDAIENVCSGREAERVAEVYHPDFHDHVNTMQFHGHDGARESVALYRRLFPDLRFIVDEQVSEGDRVATGWTLYGTNRGRTVKLTGHTISRFADGLVVEDHGSTDTIELLRQLGAWRSLVMLATEWRFLLRLGKA